MGRIGMHSCLLGGFAFTAWAKLVRQHDQFSKNVVQIFAEFSQKNIQLAKEDMNFLSQFKMFEA